MTKLRAMLFAASLLWMPPTFAATHQAKAQSRPPVKKVKVVASPKNFEWCDFHVCQEPVHLIGTASYYGKGYWQGRMMANGKRFDYRKLTAACWSLPLGTRVEVLNLKNCKTVTVEITDRGPAHHLNRVMDLSQAAAEKLDFTHEGLTKVLIRPLIEVETTNASIEASLVETPQNQIVVDNTVVASIIENHE